MAGDLIGIIKARYRINLGGGQLDIYFDCCSFDVEVKKAAPIHHVGDVGDGHGCGLRARVS